MNPLAPDQTSRCRYCLACNGHQGKVIRPGKFIFTAVSKNSPPIFARQVYFAGEAASCPRRHSAKCSKSWYSMQEEVCSWQLSLPRAVQREVISCALGIPPRQKNPSNLNILVVNRKDAHSRFIQNHREMMTALRKANPSATFREFVAADMSLEDQIRAFAWADFVIAPHGAALGQVSHMNPGGAVLEIGYPKRSMPLIFMGTASSVGQRYFLSIAKSGGHDTGLVANIQDVVSVARKAVQHLQAPGE